MIWTYPVRVPSTPGSRNMQHVSVYTVVVRTCRLCSGFQHCVVTPAAISVSCLNGLRCDSRLGQDLAGVKLEMGDVKLVSSQSPFYLRAFCFLLSVSKEESHICSIWWAMFCLWHLCRIYLQRRTGMLVTLLLLFASALVTHWIFEPLLSNLYTKAPTFVYYKWNQFKPLHEYPFVTTYPTTEAGCKTCWRYAGTVNRCHTMQYASK